LKKISPKPQFSWEHIKEFCETLTDDEDSLTREMVACISHKWSLWTMSIIAEYRRPMRFSRIMENVAGVSQKSLTKTLRQLERGGLVTRVVFAEVPPRVEYKITKLGEELLAQLHPVWLWTVANVKRFEAARSKYAGDGRKNPWIKPRVPR